MKLDLSPWSQDAADLRREEAKRRASPPSFFFSQGHALVLAAGYFTPTRLTGGYTGVARKHLHRIQPALFGQLLASLAYLFKDLIAQVVDLVPTFDEKIRRIGERGRVFRGPRTSRDDQSPGDLRLEARGRRVPTILKPRPTLEISQTW